MAETKIKRQALQRKYYLKEQGGAAAVFEDLVVSTGYLGVEATAATSLQFDISFGVTFDAASMVNLTFVGKNTSTSTTYPPSSGESEILVNGLAPTTTGITAYLRRNDAGNLTNAHVYFVCWTAIGAIA